MKNDGIILQLNNIYKSFGHIQALDGADFLVKKASVTAIVGDNGSGKSTLAKIITGCLKPDRGEIILNGKTYSSLTNRAAIREGHIAAVYQDLALDNFKNPYENIFLGREITRAGVLLDRREMRNRAQALFDELAIHIPDMELPVGAMSGGQRQAIAIARAIDMKPDIFIFDEPTSAMGMKETQHIMELFQRLKSEDKTIILISHNLFQVFDIADTIAVMEKGRIIDYFPTEESTPQKVYDMIIKKEMELEQ